MNKLALIFLASFLALGHARAEDNLVRRISVHQNSKIGAQKVISLEDIADLTGFDSETLENLKKLEIADAPKMGEKKHFTNIGFAQILRAKLADTEDANEIILNIPNEVLVSRKSAKLENLEVETEFLAELRNQCKACEYELTSLVLPIINQDLSGNAIWKIKIQNQTTKGSFSVPIEVINEDFTKRMYWLTGSVVVRKIVPVAKRNINSGETLKDDDFSFEKKDITYVNDNIASAEELKIAVASRLILGNQIIDSSSIRKPSTIRNGDTVKVFIGEDGWQVSMDGVAQQNAYRGDAVKVKISRTQKIMSGIATEKGMVEIR